MHINIVIHHVIEGAFCASSGMLYSFLNDFPLKLHFSSAPGLYKIVRPAVGESLRYKNLEFTGLHDLYDYSLYVDPLVALCREMPLAELKSKYRKTSSLEKARSGWEAEYAASSKQVWFSMMLIENGSGIFLLFFWECFLLPFRLNICSNLWV